MSKTFQSFLQERFGAARVIPACGVAAASDGILRQSVGDIIDRCLASPETWEAFLVSGMSVETVDSACEQFFRALGLAPGAPLRGDRGRVKIYRGPDLRSDGHGYRCTVVDILGSAFVSTAVCEIKIKES